VSIRLIAIDIDGTLMPTSGTQISGRNCAALRAAQDSGIEIVIATGRRHAFAMPLIAPVGLREDSVLFSSNGAVVRSFAGELIERRFLPADTARRLCGELRKHGTLVFTFDREGQAALVMENLNPLFERLRRWVETNRPYLKEIQPLERAFDGPDLPIQGMICGSVEQMKRTEEELRAEGLDCEVSMHRTEYPARDLSMLDLLPLGCSKGAALRRLAQTRGLSSNEIMAIGDNFNDLEMLEFAGRAVVMSNAAKEMLAIADERGWERAATNDEDGAALTIEAVLGGAPDRTLGWVSGPPKGSTAGAESEDTMAGWVR
jgi:Cof subfamily protein (haloacid dehalogenase superfamily)